MNMTLREVARLAGVSPSTVSRVVNAKGGKCASPQVQARIWKVVRETGYVPNTQARALKEGRPAEGAAFTIHCLFARREEDENGFFRQLADAVQVQTLRSGCRVGGAFAVAGLDTPKARGLAVGRMDGLVVLGKLGRESQDFVDRFKKRVAYVTLNQMDFEADHIVCDGRVATQRVLRYLYENGHRHIAYAGERRQEIRYTSFLETMEMLGLPVQRRDIFEVDMTQSGGCRAAWEWMACSPRPTAVFCANDMTAIGFLQELNAQGMRVPADVSVISIDNIQQAAQTGPGLTTARMPVEEMGRWAVKILVDRMRRGHMLPVKIYVPMEMVVRGSVAPAPQKSCAEVSVKKGEK